MAKITHKRGDTLEWVVTLTQDSAAVDVTNWTIKSQIRTGATLLQELTVEKTTPASGEFTLSATASETSDWPLGTHQTDIELIDDNSFVVSSQTFDVQVVRDITYV